MLEKSRISELHMLEESMFSQHWKHARVGKFTSSQIWKLMGEKGLGETGLTYIDTRAFEKLSGVSTDQDFINESTSHGIAYEPVNLNKFEQAMGVTLNNRQILVYGKTELECSTPDAICLKSENKEKTGYYCFTVEAKCFQAAKHMKCAKCDTPIKLKEVDPQTFWQCIDQMYVVSCLEGYASYYHPDLPIDRYGQRIIKFEYKPLMEEFKKLISRKQEAFRIYNDILKTN